MDDNTVNCFSYAIAFSTVSVIDEFRKEEPNIRVRISDPYTRTAQEGAEVGAFPSGIQGAKSVVGSSGSNIASPSFPLPPLDPTRRSNLARAFFMLIVDTFCVKKLKSSDNN